MTLGLYGTICALTGVVFMMISWCVPSRFPGTVEGLARLLSGGGVMIVMLVAGGLLAYAPIAQATQLGKEMLIASTVIASMYWAYTTFEPEFIRDTLDGKVGVWIFEKGLILGVLLEVIGGTINIVAFLMR